MRSEDNKTQSHSSAPPSAAAPLEDWVALIEWAQAESVDLAGDLSQLQTALEQAKAALKQVQK